MSNFRIVSNVNNNYLPNLGGASLNLNKIVINVLPDTKVMLLRDSKTILLANNNHPEIKIDGLVKSDDVYTLDNGTDKLILTIKEEVETNNILQNQDWNLNKNNNIQDIGIAVNSNAFYEADDKKQKNMLSIGIVVLLLLIVSVVFGVNQKNKTNFLKKSEEILSLAQNDYQKSLELKDVDIKSSREFYLSAKENVDKLTANSFTDNRFLELKSKMELSEAEILGEKKVDIKEYLDLTLQVNSFSGNDLVSTGKQMFIFDKNLKSIIQVDIPNKKAKIVAGKDKLEGIQKIASYEEKLYGIGDEGLFRLDGEKVKVKDKNWGDALFYLYSANIYLLDKSDNKIYRFAGSTQGKNITFADKYEWIAPGIDVDLSKVTDITIDGSIWTLNTNGKIQKFTNGNPTTINIDGLTQPLSTPNSIYTNEELKYVYVLDKEKERIIVFEKNGKFKMQFSGSSLKDCDDLVVSEVENKIILLSKSKLYSFDLNF